MAVYGMCWRTRGKLGTADAPEDEADGNGAEAGARKHEGRSQHVEAQHVSEQTEHGMCLFVLSLALIHVRHDGETGRITSHQASPDPLAWATPALFSLPAVVPAPHH